MTAARSQSRTAHLVTVVSAVILFTATVSVTSSPKDLLTHTETLTLSDGTPVSGPMALAGDIAVVGGSGVAHVFEREAGGDHWVHSATLVASDGNSAFFGRGVATDGQTILVVAPPSPPDAGTVYVFERVAGIDAWQEVARLAGDENASTFGRSVAVSASTVVVGAPFTSGGPPQLSSPGVVYVFERDLGGPNAWGEAARLAGPPLSPPPLSGDGFGGIVTIDRDTVLVTASELLNIDNTRVVLHVFSRDPFARNRWERAATLQIGSGSQLDGFSWGVSFSGDTALVGTRGRGSFAAIHQRDRGGANAWGTVTRLLEARPGFPAPFWTGGWAIGGNLAAVGSSALSGESGVSLFARHQGGADSWGEAQRIPVLTMQDAISGTAISADTVLLGSPIDVYVVDTDRDGRRDGIDPCPRDPLDNVEGDCTRNSAAHLVLDDLITLGDVTTETRGNEFHITATFTNTSDTTIGNPFFEVIELTGGNLLLNADGGPGGAGATLSPDVGDGILSPGESTTVTFVIRFAIGDAFRFYVSVKGEPSQ